MEAEIQISMPMRMGRHKNQVHGRKTPMQRSSRQVIRQSIAQRVNTMKVTREDLETAVAEFVDAKTAILYIARELFPQGCVVVVDSINQGIVRYVSMDNPMQLGILVENGNTWDKHVKSLTRVPRKDWHSWVRRAKARRVVPCV